MTGVVDRSGPFGDREVALVDLLDRLLAGGVVLVGDVTISLAGVDLVRVSLRALITSIAPVDGGRTVPADPLPAEPLPAGPPPDRALPGPPGPGGRTG